MKLLNYIIVIIKQNSLYLLATMKRRTEVYMRVNNYESLALLGYLIVTNEEIHSYQIRFINEFLENEEIIEYKEVIFNVIHDIDEKTSYGCAIDAFEEEDFDTKSTLYAACLQLALIDSEKCDIKDGIDSEERGVLKEIEKFFSAKEKKSIKRSAISEIRKKKIYMIRTTLKKSLILTLT